MTKSDARFWSRSWSMINRRLVGLSFLCIIILLGSLSLSYAQKDSLKTAKSDNSLVTPRYPNPERFAEFKKDRDYQYSNEPLPHSNPIEKWIDWVLRKLGKLFSGSSYESFWQYVMMAGAAALVIFILYKAKVLDYVFPSRKIAGSSEYVVGQENIHEINFEDVISNALSNGDYRLAIRLQYLKILKLLSIRELIHWKPNLTNQSYVQELEKSPHHGDFVRITRYFEFAWYGDFQIDESGFKEMKEYSTSFQEKMGLK